MDDKLTTMLRDAAAREAMAPAPAAQVRRHAETLRARRRAGVAALGVAAVVAGGVLVHDATSPDGFFLSPLPPAQTGAPSVSLPAPTTTPSAGTSATPGPSDEPADEPSNRDDPTAATGTAAAWPAPPEARGKGVWRPWTLPGYDFGVVVAARMEDGHAVVTFDRQQLYTAQQWEAKTGEKWDFDFRILNESTRTRQFVVEDDAPLYGNWRLNDNNQPSTRYTPQQLVGRIDAALLKQANAPSRNPAEIPCVPVFLFHTGRLDGTVAYLEEATQWIG